MMIGKIILREWAAGKTATKAVCENGEWLMASFRSVDGFTWKRVANG